MHVLVRWSLIMSAAWWLLQMGFVLTFFTLGQPFGALSDLSNALNVIFLLPLGLYLQAQTCPHQPFFSVLAMVVGFAGVLSTALASFLILFGRIDFPQSLPPIMAGFCGIGAWILVGNLLIRGQSVQPISLNAFGTAVGLGLTVIGLLFAWGDINLAFSSGKIWSTPTIYPVLALIAVGYLGLPVWSLLLGRQVLLRRSL
jgi:hypothetical protein